MHLFSAHPKVSTHLLNIYWKDQELDKSLSGSKINGDINLKPKSSLLWHVKQWYLQFYQLRNFWWRQWKNSLINQKSSMEKKYKTYFSFDIQLSGNEENEDCNRLRQTENTKMRLPLWRKGALILLKWKGLVAS